MQGRHYFNLCMATLLFGKVDEKTPMASFLFQKPMCLPQSCMFSAGIAKWLAFLGFCLK